MVTVELPGLPAGTVTLLAVSLKDPPVTVKVSVPLDVA